MKDAFKLFTAIWICLFISTVAFGSESQPPPEGGVLPEIILAAPQSPELQEYLGLSGDNTFKIPEIKAEVVIIEIFSMY